MRSKYHLPEILTTCCARHAGDFEHNQNGMLNFIGGAIQLISEFENNFNFAADERGLTLTNFPRKLTGNQINLWERIRGAPQTEK